MNCTRIGCSGWNYDDWKASFYRKDTPRRRWLQSYAERFGTVEVNSTFYRLARRSAVENWIRDTPDEFRFAVKASRFLTHVKRLTDLDEGFKRFYDPLEPLIEGRRMGPVLWQLPENFHRDDERLDAWLKAIPKGLHTIEFRDPSWFVPEVLEQLREHRVALTIGDHPQRSFQSHEATAQWQYVRFHYGTRGRSGNYSASELDTWARRIAQWRRDGDVWGYFNNDWNGFAPRNAAYLQRRFRA